MRIYDIRHVTPPCSPLELQHVPAGIYGGVGGLRRETEKEFEAFNDATDDAL